MTTMIEYFNSLSYDKKYVYEEGSYVPFAVGKYFSRFPDALMHVAQVNFPNIDKKLHHDYLWASLRPKRRFAKSKNKQDTFNETTLQSISHFLGVNRKVARDYLALIDDNQREQFVEIFEAHVK